MVLDEIRKGISQGYKVRVQWLAKRLASLLLVFILLQSSVVKSSMEPIDLTERVRSFTRTIEFDYASWTIDALWIKNTQATLSIPQYLDESRQRQLVEQYLDLVNQTDQIESEIERIYSDPRIANPASKSAPLRQKAQKIKDLLSNLGPLAESILQQQVSVILAEQGLTLGGQPIPPVLYHVTPLPLALIISPRNIIREDMEISLLPNLPLEQIIELEKQIEKANNVSALVVPVGGIGLYPTMVMSTADLPWLSEVIAHEWTHNFLTLRPLGVNYFNTPEMRTINETTASIVGKEIGRLVLERYYPDRVLPAEVETEGKPQSSQKNEDNTPPPFNYRAEMHETRVNVDRLLAEGKIQEAEDYMEMRRSFLWDHGYQIRRLNQAYFAFYGAYADTPGGAAGNDPVGPAVRALRAQSRTLSEFLNRISWVTSFDQLKQMVNNP